MNKFAQKNIKFPTYEDTTQNINVENQRFKCLRLVCSTEGGNLKKRLPSPPHIEYAHFTNTGLFYFNFKILSNVVGGKFLKFWSSKNFFSGHVRSRTKFGPDRLNSFDVYWIPTNRHPDKQYI